MIETTQQYLDSLSDDGKTWVSEFIEYMSDRHPEQEITIFRQCPMYKKGKSYLEGYVMFTAAKTHFTFHTLNFDLVSKAKELLPKAAFGKGCIKVKYKNTEYIPIVKELVNEEVSNWK